MPGFFFSPYKVMKGCVPWWAFLLILAVAVTVVVVVVCRIRSGYQRLEGDEGKEPEERPGGLDHPTLLYQRRRGYLHPAVLGDFIRAPATAGPYPVPAGALKETSERYGMPFHSFRRPLLSHGYFRPYEPNADLSHDIASRLGVSDIPFYTSHNAFSPFPEVGGAWEKVGLATKDGETGKDTLLNVYRRPIAPLNDHFEYNVQDRDGFVIKLRETFLQDGDKISHVDGKDGTWTFRDYVKNKWVWY